MEKGEELRNVCRRRVEVNVRGREANKGGSWKECLFEKSKEGKYKRERMRG